ncbi:hypothetical protein F751_4282 [Auxenochlorella protothecoides]|uniref:Uncharacterized protein n=1 Tax=Auxenochlorella protothecoides TaxID=3075 RepID=A0A087SA84_AUXPR|nr:hypothetical protein F751_4282 [Auxenochlorella protothecoides]KFM22638.1 hypothetical protein F751_4282 [Auxenochlorella protothecoides]RMZ57569.1 hypothetical protein APUTEX25_001769 [Auxenochlorella protothecoides]|eukprot:RMZ57569.1 hypothetical protein APUTEX25_001769 [Auxenochlorella protothecoides]
MEELSFEDFPGTTLRVWLFTNVTNSKDVQAAMVEGTLEYEAAIMNAAVVPSLFAVHLAAHHALLSKQRGSLRTRSLHSELVCNLSGSKHYFKCSDTELAMSSLEDIITCQMAARDL